MKTNSVLKKDRNDCCGCSLCRDICPKDAIQMQPDPEGFEFPVVNLDLCINCGLCLNKCPTEEANLKGNNSVIKTFSGKYVDLNKVKRTSSGGLCDAVASFVIEEGGVVYGVAHSSDFHSVEVKRIQHKEELSKIRGSKYVQSLKPKGIFSSLKKDIKNNLTVLYIGLPCEIAAVKSLLGNPDNLITIEIICSGVPSPKIHQQFAQYIEDSHNSLITDFTYRKKQHGWHWPYVEVKSGSKLLYNKSWSTMELGYAFSTLVRHSCYNCKFKGLNNVADITAGDFWGLKKNDKRYYKNGVSAIIIHTDKGLSILHKLNDFELHEATYSEILAGNPRLISCTRPRPNRQFFSEVFVKEGIFSAYRKNLSIKDRLRNTIMTIYSILNLR